MNMQSRERALVDPEATFLEPRLVVAEHALSDTDKIRMLLNWRYDLFVQQIASTENMLERRADADLAPRLQAVNDALIALGHRGI